jgi:hypothetical protein
MMPPFRVTTALAVSLAATLPAVAQEAAVPPAPPATAPSRVDTLDAGALWLRPAPYAWAFVPALCRQHLLTANPASSVPSGTRGW